MLTTDSQGLVDEVLALSRLAGGPGAVRALLGRLARHTAGTAALVGDDGHLLAVCPEGGHGPALDAAVRAAPELRRRGVVSAVLPGDQDHPVRLVSLGTGDEFTPRAPYLVVVGPEERQDTGLLTHAAHLLGLARRLERAERDCRRLRSAEGHSREAVLHLLMVGEVAPARRIAAALRPPLPSHARVLLVDCPADLRTEVAAHVTRLTGGRAWVVPCPVRVRHLIALVPGAEQREPTDGARDWADELTAAQGNACRVGVSGEVSMSEIPAGYEEAFHGLTVARGLSGSRTGSGRRADITPFLNPQGRAWARETLEPCLLYTPARRADPGPSELLGTLSSWLTFGGAAHRHLKIHRNTLAARVRLLGSLLGLDLRGVSGQAAAWLALRVRTAQTAPPAPHDAPASLTDLLAAPPSRDWARSLLAPLEEQGPPAGSETVRAWLRADTQLRPAAEALGVSVGAVRKRLVGAERTLGRSLLHSPSAKYELWLAMTALDRW
ncbi:helix-turn-helix domain-containing protein [Streptomyces sp. TRM64462]|uniref:helix-turn-helix domain-containing protein n=1 Tax=Streptomyces sp. TRM64462 TaxID=2741726 RepID=UPI001586E0CC|nr:helix-turn-helix domain-containing protein [Streptomyces sp. TRM64462]